MNRLMFDFQTKKAEDGGLYIEGWANPASLDRGKESINPKTWKLDNFKKNPVILFDHGQDVYYGTMPVGKAISVEAKEGGLYAKVKISGSKTERITAIRDLVEEGILKAFSVGFDPGREENGNDGTKTLYDSELLEISLVPIPMHQDALGMLSKTLSDKRSKSAKRWFSTYKKRIQEGILKKTIETQDGGKLQLIWIEVKKSNNETLEKISKKLKSYGYLVDNFIENENSIKFKQVNENTEDCAVISVSLDGNTIAHLKGNKMPNPKDTTKEPASAVDSANTDSTVDKGAAENTTDPKEGDTEEEKRKPCKKDVETASCDPDIKAMGSMVVQSLIFDNSKFKEEEATKWAEDHSFNKDKVDATGESFRLRQKDPSEFEPDSFRVIEIKPGVKAVVGKLKEPPKEGETPKKGLDIPAPAPGTPIPTGSQAETGNENPMLDLLKQNNVLMGAAIMELQKMNMKLEKLAMEPMMDYNESDTTSTSEENPLPAGQTSEKSIDFKNDELEIQIKKILANQEDLSRRLKA